MAKTARKAIKPNKPQDMHTSVRQSVKQFFSPKSTRFLASKSQIEGRGRFGSISATQKSANKALIEVYGKGDYGAVDIAKISFKQKAYANAIAAKQTKVQARMNTSSPFGIKTSLFSKPQFLIKRRQSRAAAKIEALKEKLTKYNTQSNKAISQLSSTTLGQKTLTPLTNSFGKQLVNPDGTPVKRTLEQTMEVLKKAYNDKTSGAVDTKKEKLGQLIKQKQLLDDAILKAKADDFKTSTPATQLALATALTAKEKYKKTGAPLEIKNLIIDLKKTDKLSQIKFNNLYAVMKGTDRGQAIKAQAKRNVLTTTNSAKQLKQEAKYSSLAKVANLSFFQKYIRSKPLYTSVEGQQKLKTIVDQATVIKERLKRNGTGPTPEEAKILQRSLKAQSILRTLNRTTTQKINGTYEKLLKVQISPDILKNPIAKIGTDITAVKANVDDAKIKADDAQYKLNANNSKMIDIDARKTTLEAQYKPLGAEKTLLDTQSAELKKKAETLNIELKTLEDAPTKDQNAINAKKYEINALLKEQQTLDSQIIKNEIASKPIIANINSVNLEKINLEAENKLHTATIETHKTLDSEYKVKVATIALEDNKDKIASIDVQTKSLEDEKKQIKNNTDGTKTLEIQKKIEALAIDKQRLEDENKTHEDIINKVPEVVPDASSTPIKTAATTVATVVPVVPEAPKQKRTKEAIDEDMKEKGFTPEKIEEMKNIKSKIDARLVEITTKTSELEIQKTALNNKLLTEPLEKSTIINEEISKIDNDIKGLNNVKTTIDTLQSTKDLAEYEKLAAELKEVAPATVAQVPLKEPSTPVVAPAVALPAPVKIPLPAPVTIPLPAVSPVPVKEEPSTLVKTPLSATLPNTLTQAQKEAAAGEYITLGD